MKMLIIGGLLTLTLSSFPAALAFDHGDWEQLLTRHVAATGDQASTVVDYAGMLSERSALQDYLGRLADVDSDQFSQWPEAERLAFLINAYNAWTVELILGEYPDIESIRDIGGWFGSPWKKSIAPLLGKERTLDEIEHGMIRGSGEFDEPRIHFAVNCASIGCPALRPEAYVAGKLDAQLEAQTRDFLGDRSRNAWRDGDMHVSPIFKWYREDFEAGWRGADSLRAFLASYADALGLSADQEDALRAGRVEIRYTDYDWRLNDAE